MMFVAERVVESRGLRNASRMIESDVMCKMKPDPCVWGRNLWAIAGGGNKGSYNLGVTLERPRTQRLGLEMEGLL